MDKHAPTKEKTLRVNHKPYVSKGIRQIIMKRSELASRHRKKPTEEKTKLSNKSLLLNKYKQYRNLIVTLTRLSKKKHYKLFFEQNKTNIEQTWDGIKELVTLNKKQKFTPHKLTLQRNNVVIHD